MTRDDSSHLILENRVEISKNQVEIEHNKSGIEKNTEQLARMHKDFSRLRRMVTLLLVLCGTFFVFIFINGYLVFKQTGLTETSNRVFDNSQGNL